MKNQLAKEALERSLLMMKYDTSKTLTENEMKVKGLLNEQSAESIKKILDLCSTRSPVEGTLNAAEIAAGFNQAFNYQTLGIFGGTDDSKETGWRYYANEMNKGNMDDLCNIWREFKELGYGDFYEEIEDDLDDEEMAELSKTFATMKYKSDKEAKLQMDRTEIKSINWFKNTYRCIFNTNSNVDQNIQTDRNNRVFIRVKGSSGQVYDMFSDGTLQKDGKLTGQKVTCAGDNRVQLVNESVSKKKLSEQFDDSSITNPGKQQQGGGQQGGGQQGGGQQGGGQQGGRQVSRFDQATANLQQQLYNAGFYIGNTGQLKNGVDGIKGNKTNAAQQAFMNGEKCGDFNKKNNYPNPPTCKEAGVDTVQQDKEILTINPNNF